MNFEGFCSLPCAVLAGALAFAATAGADGLRVIKSQPASAWREAATLEVTVFGSGFGVDSAIRFLVAGTDQLGGLLVNGVRFKSSSELIASVEIDSTAVPGAFDIEVQDGLGETTRAKSVFLVEPYAWAERFGCSGAESWRQRIPCRRGTID